MIVVDRLAAAVRVSARTLAVARQSVLAGMGLSLLAMAFAAAGAITPVAGALLQEAIDVAVILNALRSLADPSSAVGAGGVLRMDGRQADRTVRV